MSTRQAILIMAGGTGGHVYPALAVAKALREKNFPIVWLGTHRGLEARVIPAADIPIEWLSIGGLRGKGLFTLLMAPFNLLIACLQAAIIIHRVNPSMVLGMGGFVTGPGGLMSRLLGKPLVIHEQNAIAGLTNKLLSHIANTVLQAFPNTFNRNTTPLHVGNPVRLEIISAAKNSVKETHGQLRVLVIGGSLGAKALNEIMPQAIQTLPAGLYPEIRHQTGTAQQSLVESYYQQAGIEAEVLPFIEDMAAAYSWADLLVCRAGAMTIAELAIMGLPAILIPFPQAVDDHQTANARYLVDAGAALLLDQAQLTKESLGDAISALTVDRAQLKKMSQAAKQMAKPDATDLVVSQCLFWAGAYHGS